MSELSPQDPLDFIKQRLGSNEAELRNIALELETSKSLASLQDHDGWKHIVANVMQIVERETERLTVDRMDFYELGRRQGFIRALRAMARTKPLTDEEVAKHKERATFLVNLNSEDRAILEVQPR